MRNCCSIAAQACATCPDEAQQAVSTLLINRSSQGVHNY